MIIYSQLTFPVRFGILLLISIQLTISSEWWKKTVDWSLPCYLDEIYLLFSVLLFFLVSSIGHLFLHWFKVPQPCKSHVHTEIISGGSNIDPSPERAFSSLTVRLVFLPILLTFLWLFLQRVTRLKHHCPSFEALAVINPKSIPRIPLTFHSQLICVCLYRHQSHAGFKV